VPDENQRGNEKSLVNVPLTCGDFPAAWAMHLTVPRLNVRNAVAITRRL
jgi:hypothetical protein